MYLKIGWNLNLKFSFVGVETFVVWAMASLRRKALDICHEFSRGDDEMHEENQLKKQTKTKIKCADLNRYTFSSMFSNEKVYLFKSAHFILFQLRN